MCLLLLLLLHQFLLQVDASRHLRGRHHNASSCPESLDAEINQVLLGQCREDRHVNFTVDKVLNVMLKSEAGQQCFDIIVFRQLLTLADGR